MLLKVWNCVKIKEIFCICLAPSKFLNGDSLNDISVGAIPLSFSQLLLNEFRPLGAKQIRSFQKCNSFPLPNNPSLTSVIPFSSTTRPATFASMPYSLARSRTG